MQRNIYETTFIVNASLDDAQIEAVIGRVQDVITKNGGTVTSLNRWGRKRLAYPIKKKTTGFYAVVEFDGPGSIIQQLERMYQLDELILRHLILRLSANALKAKAKAQSAAAAQQPQAATPLETKGPLFENEEVA